MCIHLREGDFDAIIFDCDGTLVDTAPAHFNAYYDALVQAGIQLKWDWYRSRVGLTSASLIKDYQSDFRRSIPYSHVELMSRYSRAFQQNLNQLQEIRAVPT
ncbi:MAG TPA: HAD hydrolase-like protein [Acidobacteriaceae bacterium]|jgi:beta-phosphoglucomutase-like phosphatase (HAD superfamily)